MHLISVSQLMTNFMEKREDQKKSSDCVSESKGGKNREAGWKKLELRR